ncbi:MAG TPA: transcription antitermination factor NusB [Acidimicrobiales bacterium]|nr:transcription antitermination factor NusB [Acidimicrobiales bacterium]
MSELGLSRRRARERALEILYESAIKDRTVAVVLNELNTRPDAYAVELVTSASLHQDRADALISEFSIDWPLERIALVDRLIMTLAIGEMLMENPPPVAVILDEAVELAKVFSTDGSSSFVNGVLSSISQRLLEGA